jgi:hypothetical protein
LRLELAYISDSLALRELRVDHRDLEAELGEQHRQEVAVATRGRENYHLLVCLEFQSFQHLNQIRLF